MKILVSAFLCTSVLFASNSVDFGIASGYRHDNLHWSLYDNQGFNALDMKYEGLQSAEIEGYIKGIYRHIYAHAYGDYAWILSGTNKTAFLFDPNLNPDQIPPLEVGGAFQFSIPLHGWLSDAEAVGGISIPLWERGKRHFFITPIGGGSGHWQSIHYTNPNPPTSLITDIPTGLPFDSAQFVPNFGNFSSSWWGPMAGINLGLRPIEALELEFEYSRLFLQHRQTQTISGVVVLDLGGTPIPESIFLNTTSKFRLQGNQVRGKIAYHILPFWKLGLTGSFLNTESPTVRKMDIAQQVDIPDFNVSIKFTDVLNTKSNWIMYDLLLESSLTF